MVFKNCFALHCREINCTLAEVTDFQEKKKVCTETDNVLIKYFT